MKLEEVCTKLGLINDADKVDDIREVCYDFIRSKGITWNRFKKFDDESLADYLWKKYGESDGGSFQALCVSSILRYFNEEERTCTAIFVMQGLPTHDEVWEHIKKNDQKFVNRAIKAVDKRMKQCGYEYELSDYKINKFRYSRISRELEVEVGVREDALC